RDLRADDAGCRHRRAGTTAATTAALATGRARRPAASRPTNVPRGQRLASSSRTGGGAGWLAAVPDTESVGDSPCLLLSGCVAVLGRCIGSLLVLLTDAARSAYRLADLPLSGRASPKS